MLCVNNLAHTPQAATLQLPGHSSARITDLFGGAGFPDVPADGNLTLSLGSRDFFWLHLDPADRTGGGRTS